MYVNLRDRAIGAWSGRTRQEARQWKTMKPYARKNLLKELEKKDESHKTSSS